MSLELISKIEKIEERIIKRIIAEIELTDYKRVYYLENYNTYGFILKNNKYIPDSPPLFDLVFDNNYVSISVYGDLNDLKHVENIVTNIFNNNGININLKEEGEGE